MQKKKTKSKTMKQIEEQKKKWFGPARNKRRRERYATDREYRNNARKAARETYARTHVRKQGNQSLQNLGKLEEFGTVRNLRIGSKVIECLSFSTEEIGQALGGYRQPVMAKWQMDGKLPRPIYSAEGLGRLRAYTKEEAEAMIQIIGELQTVKSNYTKNDKRVTLSLFKRIEFIRSKIK
jgi:hypothetical protein